MYYHQYLCRIPQSTWEDVSKVRELDNQSYNNLIENFGYDHEKVSRFIGKSRSHISNSIRLLSLPEKILDLIRINKISQGHAKVLVGLENAVLLTDKIIKKKLSVRQLESLVRLFKNGSKKPLKSKNANTIATENDLSEKIGMKVILNNKKNNSGTLSIEYKDFDNHDSNFNINVEADPNIGTGNTAIDGLG